MNDFTRTLQDQMYMYYKCNFQFLRCTCIKIAVCKVSASKRMAKLMSLRVSVGNGAGDEEGVGSCRELIGVFR